MPDIPVSMTAPLQRNAMTVDVEDYFHVSAFESSISRAAWDTIDSRVEANTEFLLDLFEQGGCKATFFTLAWVAKRHPALLRRIADAGHEVGSHGCEHVRITQLDEPALRADLTDSKKLLEDLSGTSVVGYRAPSFSIMKNNLGAFAAIAAAGYVYSSSIYPVHHDLYGIPDAPRFPFVDQRSGVLEIPVTTVRLGGRNIPVGGGGFFRFYPYAVSRWAFDRVNRRERQPAIFYTHP
jgi:polysaccharide deacetylase family protein (PEP-CTERM system associated)